jgi:tetratricopeptide (TPR) repeat protein
MDGLISRFTPSLMAPAALEAMLVQRQDLADTLVERVRESVLTPAKHHSLLVGPRGIGKTHLVSLVYHRVQAMDDLRDRLRVAWLREEEWGVASFLDLLLRILRALHEEYRDRALADEVEAIYALESADEALVKAEGLLRTYVGERTLLVLIENLDEVFRGLGEEGQQQFRAYVQQHPSTTLLATSQSLFAGVSNRSLPFYGFFRVHHLKPFSLDEAAALLANIAAHEGKDDLAEFIGTAEGRARIRAVHHLAGGSPRVYVILSQFLTREALDALVEPFMRMLDDLTPYYQARMAWLSPQQRKIVEVLVEHRAALPVKQIASRCFITQQTASSQLKVLRETGYVRSETHGRESYYELREPLMRFSLEVKKHRGAPIRLFVDLLRAWYTRPELQHQLDLLRPDAPVEREHLLYALDEYPDDANDPRVAACLLDFKRHTEAGEYDLALQVAEELIQTRGEPQDWVSKWGCLMRLRRFEEVRQSVDDAITHTPEDATLWETRAMALLGLERFEDALSDAEHACRLAPDHTEAWFVVGLSRLGLEQFDEANEALETASRLGLDSPGAWAALANALEQANRPQETLATINRHFDAENSEPANEKLYASVQRIRGSALLRLGRYQESLDVFEMPLLTSDPEPYVQIRKGVALLMTNGLKHGWELIPETPGLSSLSSRDLINTFKISTALSAYGPWDQATRFLENSYDFREGPEFSWRVIALGIIISMFNMQPIGIIPDRIHNLIDISIRHKRLPILSAAFISTLTLLLDAPSKRTEAWRTAWTEAVKRYPDFASALRLLDATLAYRESKDRRELLALPVEERKLLEQVLGLEESNTDEG